MQAMRKVAVACAYANPKAIEALCSLPGSSPEEISYGVDQIKKTYAECYELTVWALNTTRDQFSNTRTELNLSVSI